MPIPQPGQTEKESEYISRCISSISDEYENNQAYAICKSRWDDTTGLSLTRWKAKFVQQADLQSRIHDLFKNKTKTK
jgi:hypothetical protein